MRKVFWLFLLLVISKPLWGQTEKGGLVFGASLFAGGSSVSRLENSSTLTTVQYSVLTRTNFSIGLSPQVGYFVLNNLLVGGGMDGMLFRSTGENKQEGYTQRTKGNSFSFGPFVEYYIGHAKLGRPILGIYGNKGFRSAITRTNSTLNGATYYSESMLKSQTLRGSVKLGYGFFLNDIYILKLMAGYNYIKSNAVSQGSSNGMVFPQHNIETEGENLSFEIGITTTFKSYNVRRGR